ncbi:hypothetical protein [Paraburkholderia sp. BCC1886]|uniref:hypothetical protein n=1 Tax=Paraburkholderia sp. BCC1886 TaxID=2562670 RepID=UPI0011828F9F|nr:hypothetical protein [Paraburkholderia sp. BCC1886]
MERQLVLSPRTVKTLAKAQSALDEAMVEIKQKKHLLSKEEVEQLRDLSQSARKLRDFYIRNADMPAQQLADAFDLTQSRISQIRNHY